MIPKKNKFNPNPNTLKKTFCVFQERNLEEIKDFAVDFKSESGSKYFYLESGMYRLSNHWGRLANSKWRLIEGGLNSDSKFKLGFAFWDNFYPDNDYQALYFLEVDWNLCTIFYQHKNCKSYDGKSILRTSKETQKRLKNARNILILTNWAKHFDDDIELLREKIINDLIYTDLSLEQIKRKYL